MRIWYTEIIDNLKYVSKCVRLIARFWNIFANSHLMHVISIVLDSEHYIDNFEPVFVVKTAKFGTKKKAGKFFVFWKTILDGIKFISAYSPLLEESKYIYFILVSWPDKTQWSKMCRWLTRFPSVWKTPSLCVTLRFFFPCFFLLFKPLFVSLSLFTLVTMTTMA